MVHNLRQYQDWAPGSTVSERSGDGREDSPCDGDCKSGMEEKDDELEKEIPVENLKKQLGCTEEPNVEKQPETTKDLNVKKELEFAKEPKSLWGVQSCRFCTGYRKLFFGVTAVFSRSAVILTIGWHSALGSRHLTWWSGSLR